MTNAETLIRKGKPGAAAFVKAECLAGIGPPAHLQALLDYLLHPIKDIGDSETIDWCRWLVGGGKRPEDFTSAGKRSCKEQRIYGNLLTGYGSGRLNGVGGGGVKVASPPWDISFVCFLIHG